MQSISLLAPIPPSDPLFLWSSLGNATDSDPPNDLCVSCHSHCPGPKCHLELTIPMTTLTKKMLINSLCSRRHHTGNVVKCHILRKPEGMTVSARTIVSDLDADQLTAVYVIGELVVRLTKKTGPQGWQSRISKTGDPTFPSTEPRDAPRCLGTDMVPKTRLCSNKPRVSYSAKTMYKYRRHGEYFNSVELAAERDVNTTLLVVPNLSDSEALAATCMEKLKHRTEITYTYNWISKQDTEWNCFNEQTKKLVGACSGEIRSNVDWTVGRETSTINLRSPRSVNVASSADPVQRTRTIGH
ncbi:hypothetical protein RRG08_055738 [Elysia crispata]|uniref:Uncharacterized protein n=1 Tax=Elysia crispata TaxID=231223 RepID=A0AAE1E770_9GAST|nr:hypothetical protein RRG08_055738 [Elysia crispata]